MPAVTPSGSRRMMLVKPFSYSPPDLPSRCRAAPAKKRRLSMMNGTSAPETEIGFPTSSASGFVRGSGSAPPALAGADRDDAGCLPVRRVDVRLRLAPAGPDPLAADVHPPRLHVGHADLPFVTGPAQGRKRLPRKHRPPP